MTRQLVRYFATAVYFAARTFTYLPRKSQSSKEGRKRERRRGFSQRRHKASVVRAAIRKIYKGKRVALTGGSRNTRSFAIYNLQKLHKSPCDIGYAAICCPPFFVLFSVTASFIVRIVSRGDAIMQSVVEELTNFVIAASPSVGVPIVRYPHGTRAHLEAADKKKDRLRVSSVHVAVRHPASIRKS